MDLRVGIPKIELSVFVPGPWVVLMSEDSSAGSASSGRGAQFRNKRMVACVVTAVYSSTAVGACPRTKFVTKQPQNHPGCGGRGVFFF